jgi:hypothetical protein
VSILQIPKDIDTLRAHVDEWSLADDAGLLHVLQEFSTRLKSEMRMVENNLDELCFETKSCSIALRNTFTAFSMLSNKQVNLYAFISIFVLLSPNFPRVFVVCRKQSL